MNLLLLIPSVLFAVLPMVLFLVFIWWLDHYDREPVWLLFLTFAWGAIGGVLFALLGSSMALAPFEYLGWFTKYHDILGAVVVAPLIEEPAKALFLLLVLWNRNFDGMTDGFVYGAAAGLGFGMTENYLYFQDVALSSDPGSWILTVFIRTFYSAVMHGAATSMVGAGLGFGRYRGSLWLIGGGLIGLFAAMSMHAFWNGILSMEAAIGTPESWSMINFIGFPFELLVVFVVFQLSMWEQGRTIRRELDEEAAAGRLPSEHPERLASWIGRHQSSWLPKGIHRRRYVRAATSLAIRKWQLKKLKLKSEFHRDEVIRLRRLVARLLGATERNSGHLG